MPPPRPMPKPMPWPVPPPMPKPQPPKPNYGCRSFCRPMCNSTPTCGMGTAQLTGSTMVCGRQQPSYNPYNSYNPYGNYGNNYYSQPAAQVQNQKVTLPAQAESPTAQDSSDQADSS